MVLEKYLYDLATDRYKGPIAGLIKIPLFLLSLIYGLIVRILAYLNYLKPLRLACKVISVGNITLGGTGKTSLVEFIADYLKEHGRKAVILSRGYKRKTAKSQSFNVTGVELGDEPYMLQKNLGNVAVIVDTDRRKAAVRAIEDYGADTVILDDGFQQWGIKKDLEIVTIDATEPFGNRHMIPRGILREPLSSLKRADIFVLTKTNLNPDTLDVKGFLQGINPDALIVESAHKPCGFYELGKKARIFSADALKGGGVTLFSGIGDPDSFDNLIGSLGIKVELSFKFPDHHRYSEKDIERIVSESRKKDVNTIITTEKDAARFLDLRSGAGLLFLVLRIELKITQNEERFLNRLLKLYNL